MPRASRFLACIGLTLAALPVAAGEGPRRLCPEDAPEGVRLPQRRDCPGAAPMGSRSEAGRHRIGDVQVRVGGRVTLDHDMRR